MALYAENPQCIRGLLLTWSGGSRGRGDRIQKKPQTKDSLEKVKESSIWAIFSYQPIWLYNLQILSLKVRPSPEIR